MNKTLRCVHITKVEDVLYKRKIKQNSIAWPSFPVWTKNLYQKL